MNTLIEALVLGFVIGLTGALAPGPTLVATITSSLKGGWTMGPKVTAGHMIVESLIVLLIIAGFSLTPNGYAEVVALVGGIALILFGIFTIRGSRTAVLAPLQDRGISENPYIAGILTSAANPYFWIWWLTIGSVLILDGLQAGLLLAGLFVTGHWGADLAWYTVVSTGIHRGRRVLSQGGYRVALMSCGTFLIVFGVYYLISAGFVG